MADLAEALIAASADDAPAAEAGAQPPPLRLTVAGRPNVGKSSLINRLLKDERLLTGPEPGLTRDAVAIRWQWHGREIELVDTAGLRRKARIAPDSLERLSGKAALAALRQAEIVLLLIDASAPLEKQDLAIANLAVEAGRGLVVAANKWDLVERARGRAENPSPPHRDQAAAAQGRDLPADLGAARERGWSGCCRPWSRRMSAGRAGSRRGR